MKFIASLFLIYLTTPVIQAADISVSQLGLNPDDTKTNATPIVRKALDQLKADSGGTLTFPKGTYHFYVDGTKVVEGDLYVSNNKDDFPKWIAMPIEKMKNITIDGNGSLFLFHHRMMAFHLEQSSKITIKNLAIDYVRPIHSDSTIQAIEKDTFTLRFEPETTYQIDKSGKFRFLVDGQLKPDWASYSFEGSTGRSKYNLAQGFGLRLSNCKAKEIKSGIVQFEGKVKSAYKVGDRITLRHM